MFADVSGFTKLSEELARLGGKAGAEQMADVISDLFGQLLSRCAHHGGEMLKFGGDAALILFRGPDHAPRAAAACMQMQEVMDAYRAPVPGVTLRISIGAHTGSFDAFVVGHSHEDLVLAGPATSETMRMEAAAGAGQVLVSDDLAAALPEDCLGERADGGWLVAAAPSAPASSVPDAEGDPLHHIPLGYRDHLLDGLLDPVHRLATIAFVHIGGLDVALSRRGPDRTAEDLQTTFAAISAAFDRYGVCLLASDVYEDGTKMIGVAGAPSTVAEPERRMLRALREVLDQELPLPVRAGVNRGHIFAGEVGPPFRRTYTIIGDVMNTAARVAGHSRNGQVLALQEVVDAAGSGVKVKRLAPFEAKGKTEPLVPLRIDEVSEHRVEQNEEAGSRRGTRLVGRDAELAALVEACDGAAAGRGSSITIVGEVGMGKTRLVEQALDGRDDLEIRRIRCEPYESQTPWFPFRHLLAALVGLPGERGDKVLGVIREVVADGAPEALPWLPLLAPVIDAEVDDTPQTAALDEQYRRARTVRLMAQLLPLAVTTPSVWFFDDLHDADEASRELLGALTPNTEGLPLLVIGTSRRDLDTVFPTASRLNLGPLADTDIEELLADPSVDPPLTPADRATLVERAGGRPLFVSALLRARAGGETSLPDSVESIMAAGIDHLASEERRLVRAAAVLGSSFEQGLLHRVATTAELDVTVADRPEVRAILDTIGSGFYRFRHQLMCDVAYETMPFRDRRTIHDQAASCLIDDLADHLDDRVSVLSLHLERAGRWAECWEYARIAGERAFGKSSFPESVVLFQRALEGAAHLDVPGSDLWSTVEQLGDAALRCDDIETSNNAYRRARRFAKELPVPYARLCRKQSLLSARSASQATVDRWLREGLRALEGQTSDDARAERCGLLYAVAMSKLGQGRLRDAERISRQVIEEASAAGFAPYEAAAYLALDTALSEMGRASEAVYAERAIALLDGPTNRGVRAEALSQWAMSLQRRGSWDEALDTYERAFGDNVDAGNLTSAGFAKLGCVEILADRGRCDEAAQALVEMDRTWRSVGFAAGALFVQAADGIVALRAGDYRRAAEQLSASTEQFLGYGMAPYALPYRVALVEADIGLGRCDEADVLLQELRRGADPRTAAELTRLQAELLAARGELDVARDTAVSALEAARQAEDSFLELRAHLARATIDPSTDLSAEIDRLAAGLGLAGLPASPAG